MIHCKMLLLNAEDSGVKIVGMATISYEYFDGSPYGMPDTEWGYITATDGSWQLSNTNGLLSVHQGFTQFKTIKIGSYGPYTPTNWEILEEPVESEGITIIAYANSQEMIGILKHYNGETVEVTLTGVEF